MLLYYFLISCGLISAILVIVSNNPIHGVLALILLFLNSSILLLTYEVNFLALIIIIIYLGAVTILFLFTLMMLNLQIYQLLQSTLGYLPIGSTIALILFTVLIWISNNIATPSNIEDLVFNYTSDFFQNNTIQILGYNLYIVQHHYLITSSLILLLAMVSAISLSLENQKYILRQDISVQMNTRTESKMIELG